MEEGMKTLITMMLGSLFSLGLMGAKATDLATSNGASQSQNQTTNSPPRGVAGGSRTSDARPGGAQASSKINAKDGLTYIWIPAGAFQMGCSPDDPDCREDEVPVHTVTLTKGFWIGQMPVTQAAYMKVMGSNPSHFHGDQLPVETVSWDDAQAYCGRMDMRLPTEAEWEYAARGGGVAARYGPIDQIAWYGANSGDTTHPVGKKQANAYGLYDVLGDVWEWTADWYGKKSYDAASVVDPKGPQAGKYHVLRGGSWVNDASGIRVSYRINGEPGGRSDDHLDYGGGFRCVGN
jgi:formylglycine-generating enzyme required for sulfatase activity